MRSTSSWLAVPGLLVAIAPAAAAVSPENAARIKSDLMARTFVAKVDLYQATVFDTGALMPEFDDDAIKIGMPILIDGIDVEAKKIRIHMKHPSSKERTWVQFAFSKSLSPGFSERPTFEKMLTRVFNETKENSPAAQEGH
jgi:hypothetical protein